MNNQSVLALDVGGKRIGVAVASLAARLASPLTTLDAESFREALAEIIDREDVAYLVVGLPRNQSGEETSQTEAVRQVAAELEAHGLPVYFQDESLTSQKAKTELNGRGRPYKKTDIDQLAAAYILEDWLNEHKESDV